MTREEALEFIAQSIKPDVDMAKVADALKALAQEPSDVPDINVGDMISREAVLDCFTATKLKKFDFILYAREEIKKLPPVNLQEPKTGHWIKIPYGFKCSNCLVVDTHTSIFCPSCGAKMVEP